MKKLTSKFSAKDVKSPVEGEDSFVKLPFPYLRLFWYNGVAQQKIAGDVRYFGGLYAGTDNVAEDLAALSLDTLPLQFGDVKEFIARDSSSFDAYEARMVYAAPIRTKDDWYEEYDEKKNKMAKRHRVDILALLGSQEDDGTISPWGLAVISAKGFMATALLDAFKNFQKKTATVRGQIAPDVPSMFFYVPFGTFGDKLIVAPAGESTYTPAQLAPLNYEDEDVIEGLYIADEAWQDALVSYQAEAEEWVNDTRSNRTKSGGEDVNNVEAVTKVRPVTSKNPAKFD